LGRRGYYFWLGSQPEPAPAEVPVLTVQKSNNVSLTAFEDGRRSSTGIPPDTVLKERGQSAEFLKTTSFLGGLSLLTGKYWEAKRMFYRS
jgi:hypothetical protein